ncbi:hypothetical protein [Psychroflexus halocasei]|uniref:Uncharacterized protein n=1 Tax=Psychroflexus halocasei TaxID=908615 RepID=A0A1H4ASQ7_9FLAO|nr:hypothetical protein [Psychroflexus halocasei]SEA38804.1 hypothetical protein SAMN05421540_105130 [Psychroflexus halocasei]
MKTTILILSIFFLSSTPTNQTLRDCDEEASRIFDYTFHTSGGDIIYSFIQSNEWRTFCEMDNETGF